MQLKHCIPLLISFFCSLAFVGEYYELGYPGYFPKPSYDLENNPLSIETISLGRALFYDPILSKDSSISCASCHSPYNAFAHSDHDLSHGINDIIGTRNAPALFNLAWQKSFMWDGAIHHLDMQSLAPISHPAEMGESLRNVVQKLQRKAIYPPLFHQAFGDSLVSGTKVLKALSQFQLTLVSDNAKYDAVQRGEDHFTTQEFKGYKIFQKNCNTCHTEPLFSNAGFANNGLAIDTSLNDLGKWMVSKQAKDSLLFKVPSLRNLSYTAPYMHDGRFRKLNEVIEHYTSAVQISPTLSPELEQPLFLSPNEKVDLIAFLLTLNDKSFVFAAQNKYPKKILHPTEGF